ncbi:MAG: SRPBCC family protein [Acidimicrobiia bacterium]|nr:SRPBCC family protein [Acidimicrobiia bacterium]
MEIQVSTVVDRSLATVWDFYAVHHVENHPRWDPDLELEKLSDEPLGLGTRIKRRNMRYDVPTEGSMEVVEFEPQRAMGVRIQDGPVETHGRATFSAVAPDKTAVTIWADFPGMDESMADKIRPLMERSAAAVKQLIESEPG